MQDLVYYRWLYKFDFDPLTSEQKEQLYLFANTVISRRRSERNARYNGTGETES